MMTYAEQPVEQSPRLSCFVTAPFGVSISEITLLLHQKGIMAVTISDLAILGMPLLEQIRDAISKADLFIAVLGRKESNSDTLVELGYASAVRKPILIVVSPELEALPASLAGLPQVVADPQNVEAVSFVLDQVLAALKYPKRARRLSTASSHPIDPHFAQELRNRLDAARSERVAGEVVASAIMASGVEVVVESGREQQGAIIDLGVWSEDLEASIGNPLVIEIKARLSSSQHVLQVRSQMQHYLQATNARTALVLYLEGPKGTNDLLTLSVPNILFMPARELLDQLQAKGFGAVIRELRNRVVHQVAA